MDPSVKPRILDRARAKELEKFEVPQVTLEEVRKQYGGASLSDEELLLRYYAGPEFVDALKNAPPRKEYLDARSPIVKLVENLTQRDRGGYVFMKRDDFTLTAGKHTD